MAHNTTSKSFIFLVVMIVLAILFILANPLFIVNEGETAVITRFGQIVQTEETTGLKLKIPFIDTVTRYSKKILSWDGDPRRVPTLEKQFIWIDTTARWRIIDPKKFYTSVNTMTQAFARLDDLVESAVRTVITRNKLVEAVRNTNNITEERTGDLAQILPDAQTIKSNEDIKELSELLSQFEQQPTIIKGRKKLSEAMLASIKSITPEFGIEVIDIVIRQIRYSDDLTESVYNRMISERKQIAQVYRSQGEGRKQEWIGQLENEKRSILSQAYSQAETIKGKADATAAHIYSQAYGRNKSFFEFWRAMESYKKTIPDMNKVLSTNGDYFKYIYSSMGRQ